MSIPTHDASSVSAHDVAEELRRRLPRLGVVKLHKLLYYAQGWHLAWSSAPLFREPVEAWANGPVVASLWADEKHGRPRPERRALTGDQLATVDYVVERYGRFTGKDLVHLTHSEDPWRDVGESDDPTTVSNPEIGHDAMREWFRADEDLVTRSAAVEKLRRRPDVYSLSPKSVAADTGDAVARALAGEQWRDARRG